MKRCIVIAISILFLSLSLSAQIQEQWIQKLNRSSSEAIALNPLDNSVVYGIQKDTFMVSQDYGDSWQKRGVIQSGIRKSMVVSPADTNIVLLHSDDLLRSTDGGFTWSVVLPAISMNGETLAFDLINPQTAYVADFVTGDFYVSEDTGATWSLRSNLGTPIACSIAPHPSIPGLIIAGAGNGRIARTTDGGFNWSLARQEDVFTFETPKVEWDPLNPNLAFASTFGGVYSVFRSDDFGATWKNSGPVGLNMWGLHVGPVNSNVYTGTLVDNSSRRGLWVSYDGGKSFQHTGQSTTPSIDYLVMIKVAENGSVFIQNAQSIYRIDPAPFGTITGTVFDDTGLETLPICRISVIETGDELYLNNYDGTFELHLPSGNYTLVAEHLGERDTTSTLIVTEGQTTTANLQLPIIRTPATLSGTLTSSLSSAIEGRATLYYKDEFGSRINKTTFIETNNEFEFENLSNLNSLDSLVVLPATLPLTKYVLDNVMLDTAYTINLELADMLISAENELVFAKIERALNRNNITFAFLNRSRMGDAISIETALLTKRRTLAWIGEDGIGSFSQALEDSLTRAVERGVNLFFSGQYLVEDNVNRDFFPNTLQIGFNSNYSGLSSRIEGYPGNVITDGFSFTVSNGGQASRDKLTTTNPFAHHMLYYGESIADSSKIAAINVDNTGFGGKAVVLGFDISWAPALINDSLWTRMLNYFGDVVGLDEDIAAVPQQPHLYQNYPNPFNPSTKIDFYLPSAARVDLTVYDMLGRQVCSVVKGVKQAGRNSVVWDGRNDFGELVASGIYCYRLQAESRAFSGQLLSRKMLLIR